MQTKPCSTWFRLSGTITWSNHKNTGEQSVPRIDTWHPLAWECQAGLPFWSQFGFLLWASAWKSSQVLGGIPQAKALGHVTQVDRFDVEDMLEVSGIGSVGTNERLQCWEKKKRKKKSEFCLLLHLYIYTLKDSAVPAERTSVLSSGTPSGQQLVDKVGMLKTCEGCTLYWYKSVRRRKVVEKG